MKLEDFLGMIYWAIVTFGLIMFIYYFITFILILKAYS